MTKFDRNHVVAETARQVRWWLAERLKKFRRLSHETMAINPFMAPAIMALHFHGNEDQFDELAELLLGGHFMTGHSTGFGKLVDEKLLPNVFKTTKVDKAFRKIPPFNSDLFDEIDHVVGQGSDAVLLSLKASRWSIQLTMAKQLNRTFHQLITARAIGEVRFKQIVVGVIYGNFKGGLPDKYRLVRGINTGAHHAVADIQQHVEVVAGRGLWTWLNGGEEQTQDWVVDGIQDAIRSAGDELTEAKKHLESYKAKFAENFRRHVTAEGIDWHAIVREING